MYAEWLQEWDTWADSKQPAKSGHPDSSGSTGCTDVTADLTGTVGNLTPVEIQVLRSHRPFWGFNLVSWRRHFIETVLRTLVVGCEVLQLQRLSWQLELRSQEIMVVFWIPRFRRGLWATVQGPVLKCEATCHLSQTMLITTITISIINSWEQQSTTRRTRDDFVPL